MRYVVYDQNGQCTYYATRRYDSASASRPTDDFEGVDVPSTPQACEAAGEPSIQDADSSVPQGAQRASS